MNWKFWKKNEGGEPRQGRKLPKPKELPSGVGRHLVVDLKHDPDWVWTLKSVSIPREDPRGVYDIRVFDEQKALDKGVAVKNYRSLDGHPELILFDGSYDKNTWAVKIEQRFDPGRKPRAA